MRVEDVDRMKVADVRATLRREGLSTSGMKPDMIARLKAHIEAQAEVAKMIAEEEKNEAIPPPPSTRPQVASQITLPLGVGAPSPSYMQCATPQTLVKATCPTCFQLFDVFAGALSACPTCTTMTMVTVPGAPPQIVPLPHHQSLQQQQWQQQQRQLQQLQEQQHRLLQQQQQQYQKQQQLQQQQQRRRQHAHSHSHQTT